MTFQETMINLVQKFTSGNNIPVERNSITREEWDAIVKELGLRFETIDQQMHEIAVLKDEADKKYNDMFKTITENGKELVEADALIKKLIWMLEMYVRGDDKGASDLITQAKKFIGRTK